jgi:hypothetical protein
MLEERRCGKMVSVSQYVLGIRASYSKHEVKDLCFCLQPGANRLSLALPHSLKDGVEQTVVYTKDVESSVRCHQQQRAYNSDM